MFETAKIPDDIGFERIQSCDLCGANDFESWDKARSNTLSRCRNCGLVFTNPRIADCNVKDKVIYSNAYFQQKSRMTRKLVNARKRSYHLEIEKLKKHISVGCILDVGCGMGVFLEEFGSEWEKHGCDVSSYALTEAKNRGLKVYQGEFEKLDFPKDFFDVVYFRASLHHVYSPGKCFERAYRILKPGGVVAITMSNNCGGVCGRLFKGHVKSYEQAHNYLFSKSVLEQYLTRSGFRILEVTYPYFGTGYASVKDIIELFTGYAKYHYLHSFSKLNKTERYNFSSPPFYGNYINIYAGKEA